MYTYWRVLRIAYPFPQQGHQVTTQYDSMKSQGAVVVINFSGLGIRACVGQDITIKDAKKV